MPGKVFHLPQLQLFINPIYKSIRNIFLLLGTERNRRSEYSDLLLINQRKWSLNCSVTSSRCIFFSPLCPPPSSAPSRSHIHVYCSPPVRRMGRLFRVSLLYPAVNPLPSGALPSFSLPRYTHWHENTHTHKKLLLTAQNMHKCSWKYSHKHPHTPRRLETLVETSPTLKRGCVCM